MDLLLNTWYYKDKKEAQKYSHFLMLGLDKKDLSYLCEKEGHEYMKKYMKNVEELNEDSEFVSIISPDKDNEMVINTLKNEAIKEGRLEGKRENTLETAKKMLKKKLDINLIAECTGLTKEEIRNLK